MIIICPIVDYKVNERITRLNAMFSVLVLGLFFISNSIFVLLFIVFDFLMRAYFKNKLSFISTFSKYIISKIETKPNLINAGPKLFAARVGLFLTSASLITFLSGATNLSYILSGTVLFFALLEVVFGYCIACKIYPFIYKLNSKLNR